MSSSLSSDTLPRPYLLFGSAIWKSSPYAYKSVCLSTIGGKRVNKTNCIDKSQYVYHSKLPNLLYIQNILIVAFCLQTTILLQIMILSPGHCTIFEPLSSLGSTILSSEYYSVLRLSFHPWNIILILDFCSVLRSPIPLEYVIPSLVYYFIFSRLFHLQCIISSPVH